MTHNKYDFIGVCNQVLRTQNLDMVERVHSLSFWQDLRAYITDSEVVEIKEHNMPISYKPIDWSDTKMTLEEAIDYLLNHYMANYLQRDKNLIAKHNAVMDMAVEALKRQMPKKPVADNEEDYRGMSVRCPVCDRDCTYDTLTVYNYCPWCGQRMDTSDWKNN